MEQGSHSAHEEYEVEGMFFTDRDLHRDTVQALRRGQAPHFDILVATQARAGTARLLELVWLLTHDCDFQTADDIEQAGRHLFLEFLPPDFSLEEHAPGLLRAPPVIAKTHFTYSFIQNLPHLSQKKIIVGLRNPKDVLVSMFHFYQMDEAYNFQGNWDEFFAFYAQGRLTYGCPIDTMLNWWKHRHDNNVLVVKYEDFVEKDTASVIKEVAGFLEQAVSSDNLATLEKRLSFKTMKDNPSTNYNSMPSFRTDISTYMRKGQAGNWREYFSPEQSEVVDSKYRNKCVPEGLIFAFM